MPYTILHADNYPIARRGMQSVIRQLLAYHLIPEEVEDGHRAIIMVTQYRPDIVLLNLNMPKASGLEVAQYVHQQFPATRVVLLATFIDEETYRTGRTLGVRGFLSKAVATASEITRCLQAITHDQTYISEDITQLLGRHTHRAGALTGEYGKLVQHLTTRERDVLTLIMEGFTSPQIAEMLHNSIKTIETHRNSIADKFNLKGRRRLTSFVTRHKASLEKALLFHSAKLG